MVNALGTDLSQIAEALWQGEAGRMTIHRLRTTGGLVPVGQVREPLPELPPELKDYQCRNHALVMAAYRQISDSVIQLRERVGADRIAVVMGSSTSGIDASEEAFFHWRGTGSLPEGYCFQSQHEMGALARFVARLAGATGPAYTLSTACSSGAKAFASAQGLLELGVCDAVIVGGADTLCHLTLNGFEALASLPREICNPLSRNRKGLNIGEGAALFILSREPHPIRLLGVGESSDAYHISAPDPQGRGAEAAIRHALAEARLTPGSIGYINLHGTGTPHNDSMEAPAVDRIFGKVPVSSTKPQTGHCLGAAGSLEAGFCWLALEQAGKEGVPLPPHHWDGEADERLPAMNVAGRGAALKAKGPVHLLSHSFAFGGSNCAVVLGRDFSAHEPAGMPSHTFGEPTLHVRGWRAWAPALPDNEAWQRWLLERPPLPEDDGATPPCAEVPPMLRRRCGRLTRMVLETALGVCASSGIDPAAVNHVHVTRFGEIQALRELSELLYRKEPLSPTLFSNSVHQTPASCFDLATGNTRISRTLSAGTEGLVCALLEALGLLQKDPATPVLVTFADELPPEPFGGNIRPPTPFAAALLCEAEPGGPGRTVHARLEPANRGGESLGHDDSLFDFLRWLEGNETQHKTASSFGLWTWRK